MVLTDALEQSEVKSLINMQKCLALSLSYVGNLGNRKSMQNIINFRLWTGDVSFYLSTFLKNLLTLEFVTKENWNGVSVTYIFWEY